MIEEDKDLLLKDLSARFPYGIKGQVTIQVPDLKAYDIYSGHLECKDIDVDVELLGIQEEEIIVSAIDDKYVEIVDTFLFSYSDFTPYLRPLSSMTDEEKYELYGVNGVLDVDFEFETYKVVHLLKSHNVIDWFNKHHFDYRGLIEKNLAIEVSKENNPYKE